MKRLILSSLGLILLTTLVVPESMFGQHRRRVVVRPRGVAVRRPVRQTKLVVRTGHPVRRALPGTVVVRPARRTVVVGAPLVYLPAVAWGAHVVSMPDRERLVWEDSEAIERDEGWVDTNFGIDGQGNALFLQISGRARLNFAEVTFANGHVQVVDFSDRTHGDGIYRLLDFADGRRVLTARILAKSESDETKLAVY